MADSSRFQIDQYKDGQLYVSENGQPVLHAKINGPHDVDIQTGADGKVTIDKVYGPTVFWEIRISMDLSSCEYVIERSMGPLGEWREWTRIPGQLDEDFSG
jgi:hypothetical protein